MLYTIDEVAEFLKVSVPKVKGLLKKGALGCIQIGVDVRIPCDALDIFVADNLTTWKPCRRGRKAK